MHNTPSWSDLPKRLREIGRAARKAAKLGRSILLKGPPGTGKTMLARRLLLKPLVGKEASEVLNIYRMAGLQINSQLYPPFRAPHHTASLVGMTGDGKRFRPGEISLAHGGALFLDEAPEFVRSVLEEVAQAYSTKLVRYSGPHLVSLPADFVLVAAMNPCPCGYLGSGTRECKCTPAQVQKYRSRLKPLHFDLELELPMISTADLTEKG